MSDPKNDQEWSALAENAFVLMFATSWILLGVWILIEIIRRS